MGEHREPLFRRRSDRATFVVSLVALLALIPVVLEAYDRFLGSAALVVTHIAVDSTPERDTPFVSVSISNDGSKNAVLTRARVSILKRAHIKLCTTGGDIPDGGPFTVNLPTAGDSAAVDIDDLHQEIRAQETGRFTIRFQAQPPVDTPDVLPGDFDLGPGSYLFRLRIDVWERHDGGKATIRSDVFDLLTPHETAALYRNFRPEVLHEEDGSETTLEEAMKSAFGSDQRAAAMGASCMRENGRRFDSLVQSGDVLSSELKSVMHARSAS